MWDFRMHPPRGMFPTVNPIYTPRRTSVGGRLRAVEGATATLAVVGMGPAVPEGARVLPPDAGGSPLLEVPLLELVGRWKRLGRSRPVPG
jgi:hypothetical protein